MSVNAGDFELIRSDKKFSSCYCIVRNENDLIFNEINILHPVEKEYYNTLKVTGRKRSYLLGRISAKKAIGKLCGIDVLESILIEPGVFQFPVVKNTDARNVQVSISHCNDIGISVAFPDDHPVAVDIERIDQKNTRIMKGMKSLKECGLMSVLNFSPAVADTMLWTIKEALSKILRTGLTLDFSFLEIQAMEQQESGIYYSKFCHFNQYKAYSVISGDYVISVVLPAKTKINLDKFYCSLDTAGISETNR